MIKAQGFINIAKEVANSSKDPSTKVGAIIVDETNDIIASGYNGFIAGCDESYMTYERPEKYDLIIHSEVNALLRSPRKNLSGCTMYVTHAPCSDCLKLILQKGIRNIVYDNSDLMRRASESSNRAALKMIYATGATVNSIRGFPHLLEERPVRYADEITTHLTKKDKQ